MNNRLKLWPARGLGAIMISAIFVLVLTVAAAAAVYAQSSGNFVSTANNTICSINSSTGIFTGNSMFSGSDGGMFNATIKLPSSSPGLLVTPSLVTGMYTNTLTTGTSTSNQTAAIVVVVTDQQTGYPTVTLTPTQTCFITNDTNTHCGVAYDERFQQLTTVLGSTESVQLILSTLAAHSFNFTRGSVPGGLHTISVNRDRE